MNDVMTFLNSLTAANIDFTPTAVSHVKPKNRDQPNTSSIEEDVVSEINGRP